MIVRRSSNSRDNGPFSRKSVKQEILQSLTPKNSQHERRDGNTTQDNTSQLTHNTTPQNKHSNNKTTQ